MPTGSERSRTEFSSHSGEVPWPFFRLKSSWPISGGTAAEHVTKRPDLSGPFPCAGEGTRTLTSPEGHLILSQARMTNFATPAGEG